MLLKRTTRRGGACKFDDMGTTSGMHPSNQYHSVSRFRVGVCGILVSRTNGRITLACRRFKSGAVQDGDHATVVANDTAFLKVPRDTRN